MELIALLEPLTQELNEIDRVFPALAGALVSGNGHHPEPVPEPEPKPALTPAQRARSRRIAQSWNARSSKTKTKTKTPPTPPPPASDTEAALDIPSNIRVGLAVLAVLKARGSSTPADILPELLRAGWRGSASKREAWKDLVQITLSNMRKNGLVTKNQDRGGPWAISERGLEALESPEFTQAERG